MIVNHVCNQFHFYVAIRGLVGRIFLENSLNVLAVLYRLRS